MTATTTETGRTTYTIDASHSSVEFAVKHMMITSVKGRVAALRGTIQLDEADLAASTVEVEFDAASIDTRSEQRDEHLRSADFLNVAEFPTMRFVSRHLENVGPVEGSSFRLVGDLTIRGTTREVALDAVFEGRGRDPWGGERASFSAETTIDRRDFGLTWNQTLESGGVLVSTGVKVQIEIQAVRS